MIIVKNVEEVYIHYWNSSETRKDKAKWEVYIGMITIKNVWVAYGSYWNGKPWGEVKWQQTGKYSEKNS